MAIRVTQDDFSGGIFEAPTPADFTPRQWTILKGFVLDSETELRSQWECQRVSADGSFKAVRAFVTGNTNYLIALKTDGSIWWTTAPSRTASRATSEAVTWAQVSTGTNPSNATVSIVSDVYRKFLTEIQFLGDSSAYKAGLLLHSGPQTAANNAVLLYANSSAQIVARVYTNYYPTSTMVDPATMTVNATASKNTYELATGSTFPRANVGCMWGNFLVLGDVEWGQTYPLTSGNTKPYRNGLWISVVDDKGVPAPDRFLPSSSMNLVGTPDAVIRGLHVTDRGLLVFTSSATAGDGVILLRGTPPTGDGTVTYVQEVLRGGMGVPANPTSTQGLSHAAWPETGAVAFIDAKGTVWNTNGSDVGRLDLYGVVPPSTATVDDCLQAVGPYLFVSRAGRLLVMRVFQQDGAWTELVTPNGSAQATSLTAVDDVLYFVQSGNVYRYAMASADRGRVNGSLVDLTVCTAPLTAPNSEHDLKHWFRVGVRASGNNNAAEVRSIQSLTRSPLTGTDGYTSTLNQALGSRAEVLVHGHGPSMEAAALVVFRGDVTVECVTLWTTGKEPSR